MMRGRKRENDNFRVPVSGNDRFKRTKIVVDLYGVVKRRISFKNIAMVLLLFYVPAQVFVVILAMVLSSVCMVGK